MKEDSSIAIQSLRVDGGASANDYLMQFQSDIMQCVIERPENVESTALGAAYLAGLAVGYWNNLEEIKKERNSHIFTPLMKVSDVNDLYKRWQKAVNCARMFTKNEE
jgi:glycerol kinase